MIYLGFSVEQMINFLNRNCRSFVLVTNDVKEMKGDFRLIIYSDEYGEYEGFGCLSTIVIEAFKPFISQAREKRDEAKVALDKIINIKVNSNANT